jgi:hypothetical protein
VGDGSDGRGRGDRSGADLATWIAVGLAVGAAIGAATGNVGLWLPMGVAIGAAMGGVVGGVGSKDDRRDRGPEGDGPPGGGTDPRGPDHGGVARGLLWVLGGLVVTLLLFAAVSPELVRGAPGEGAGLAGVVLVAGVPGAVLLGMAALRRRHVDHDHDVER